MDILSTAYILHDIGPSSALRPLGRSGGATIDILRGILGVHRLHVGELILDLPKMFDDEILIGLQEACQPARLLHGGEGTIYLEHLQTRLQSRTESVLFFTVLYHHTRL